MYELVLPIVKFVDMSYNDIQGIHKRLDISSYLGEGNGVKFISDE